MQIFPSTIRNLWNIWQLPEMIILSLILQLILISLGYKRKHSSNNWLRLIVWLAYLSADWVATVSLGILSNNEENNQKADDIPEPRYVIRAFWAPFLLLHLGGPDTITAYSIQDNDLWLRHLLGLVIQSFLAFYVFLRALQPTNLNFLSIPIFVAGIIKYGERTWVLRSTCSQYLRDNFPLTDPNFIPDIKYQDRSLSIPLTIGFRQQLHNIYTGDGFHHSALTLLHLASFFFERNKRVFSDLLLSSQDLGRSRNYFDQFNSEDAFKVIELELGFMYDFFYTKASVIHSKGGIVIRFISLSSIAVTVGTFCMIDKNGKGYTRADIYLTFLLLFVALGLEIYAIILLLCSDWSVIWMTESSSFMAHLTYKVISHFGYWSINKKRWSNSVPQYNLISSCLKEREAKYLRRLWGSSYIQKIMTTSQKDISTELKKRIFKQLKQNLKEEVNEDRRKLAGYYDKFGWTLKLDLDQSILLWHIATDLCYYSDHNIRASNPVIEDSKSLSDFLTYLLVHRNSLFPSRMSQIRLRATISDAMDFLENRKSVEHDSDFCTRLLEEDTRIISTDVEGGEIKSIFYRGSALAQELKGIEESERWEIISCVWVEMLTNISCECKWYDHAKQLGHGGDLLTHFWLLMVHFGYIKQVYTAVF